MDDRLTALFLACLHQDTDRVSADCLADLDAADWQSLLAFARVQRLRALFYHRLQTRGLEHAVPSGAWSELQKAYWHTAQRNLVLFGELNRIVTALSANAMSVIVLKGAHLAGTVYESMSLREMGDLDLLVAPDRLAPAAEILAAQGYRSRSKYTLATAMASQHHLPRFTKPDVAEVELHWNVTQPNLAYSIDPGELWERALPVRIAGVRLLALCPEDLLLHICLHTSYHHLFAFGLRPLCDIAEVIRRHGKTLAWSSLVERAKRWHWERGVHLALRLAKDLVGAAVPDHALAQLCPPGFVAEMETVATRQILTDPDMAGALSTNFVRVWQKSKPTQAVREFAHSLSLPTAQLANVYAVPPDSPRIYLYYAVRLKDMLARYGRRWFVLWRGDPALQAVAQQKADLLHWLGEDGQIAN